MHELPLHPLTVTHLMTRAIDGAVLPLAEAGMKVDEVIKEPGFAQWVVYLLVAIYVMEKVGGGLLRLMGVSLPVKREINGTLTTVPEKKHAEQSDVDELEDDVRSLRDELIGMHNQSATAAAARVTALSTVIETSTRELERKMEAKVDEVMRKVQTGLDAISQKLDPVVVDVARHDTHLEDVVPRVLRVEQRLSEATGKLHDRINDLIKNPKR